MTISNARRQYSPPVIQHAVWLYLRFTLSFRDVEDLLAERGLDISYETVRRWVMKFGPQFARELRNRRPKPTLAGISMRWLFRSQVGISGCGEPLMTKARPLTFSSNDGATRPLP
jgi:hypothetical protein